MENAISDHVLFSERIDTLMAHAWVVRAFVKHSEEAGQFPELMEVVRAIFDFSRAVETKLGQQEDVLKALRKKLPSLEKATAEFTELVNAEIGHTNFVQAVKSLNATVKELRSLTFGS